MSKKPSGLKPKRTVGSRQQKRIVRVLCEGRVTEPSYFAALNRTYRAVTLTLDRSTSGLDPLSLVRAAKKQKSASLRRGRAAGPDFDEIWCVFDCDEHATLSQAVAEARDAGINVALSNPCFELWLVLHADDHRGYVERTEIQRRAAGLGLTDGKRIRADKLMPFVSLACERAHHLDEIHAGNASGDRANPSSGVRHLVEIATEST